MSLGVFWVSVAVVAYVYAGYPAMLWVYCRLRTADCKLNQQSAINNQQWGVSIVIAARNEAARLAARIDNLLALDYPADRREIIVVSDGSTDDTMQVLATYPHEIVAVAVPPGGKALALNAGVARARHEIVVFTDARQPFAADALRELTTPFADPRVGGVTGELRLDAESPCRRTGQDRRVAGSGFPAAGSNRRSGTERRRTLRSTIADGVGLYWKYEKQLRRLESAVDSTIGATGAIYAIRRDLYRPLPADTILDDVLTPMRVVLAGSRVVFNERAKAFDRAAADADAEARRKVRTLAGNYQILALEPRLLVPWRNRVWLQYVSHKVGRLVVPYALLAMFAANLILAATQLLYQIALAAQVIFYLLAGWGALLELRARESRIGIWDSPAMRIPNPESRITTEVAS